MGVIRNLEGLNRLSRGAWFVLGLICFGLVGYVEMFVFILLLLVGFAYAWLKGALEWEV